MIERTGFGYIVIDGKKYSYDVVIHVNGKITKRKKELSKPFKRGLHTPLATPEIEELLQENPEIIVIGSGQFGALPIMNEVIEKIKRNGIKIIVDRTPNVIDILNKMISEGRKVAAILHVTC